MRGWGDRGLRMVVADKGGMVVTDVWGCGGLVHEDGGGWGGGGVSGSL